MHAEGGFRSLLFDMDAGPDELFDLGVLLGLADGSEVDDELLVKIRGKAEVNYVPGKG